MHKRTHSQKMHSECSHDTIQYYLKIQCDVSEDPHRFVTTPQLNAFDMSKMLAKSMNSSRLPAPEPTLLIGNPLDYSS